MTRQQMDIFYSVVRYKSFAKAAADCGLAQSTVSREMALLENEFKATLFVRHSTGVSLTPAGRHVSFRVTSFRDLFPKMVEDCQRISDGRMPALSLCIGSLGTLLLQPVLDRLVHCGPDLSLSCHNVKYYYTLRMLCTGDADAGVLLSSDADLEPSLKQLPLYKSPWLVAARRDHSIWDLPAEDRGLLRGQTVITSAEALSGRESESLESVGQYCVEQGLPYRNFLRANFMQDQILMVRAGLGVALMPPFMKGHLPEEIRLEDALVVPYDPTFVMAWRQDCAHPGVQLLEGLCREYFGSDL